MHGNASRGFFTIAQNSGDVDYIRAAYGLAMSIKHTQNDVKGLSIGVTPGTVVDPRYSWAFDQIVEIPWGDHAENSEWKLENEWKSIWMSPYDETIKLDADMLFFSDIGSWWEMLSGQTRDVVWTNTVRDWKGDIATSDHYRRTFTKSLLPNIYTAFGYFRKTQRSYDFFNLTKMIFWNWESFYSKFLAVESRPDHPSTDVIFALACKILDIDQVDYTPALFPTFTHMKSRLQGWTEGDLSEDWLEHIPVFFTPQAECSIGNHRQVFPLHYHVKRFLSDEILETYEGLTNG